MANNLSGLDADQVIRSVYDEDNNFLRVGVVEGSTGGGSGFEVIISHTDDSIRLGDGTDFLTSTTVGPKVGLDVAVINSIPLPAGASTEAKQDVGNASLASIDSKIVTVDTDNVTIVNGSGISAVNIQDGGNSLTVDATNLDIRDLNSATDSVSSVITSSVLPTGAATSANQTTEIGHLASIDTDFDVALSTRASESTLSTLNTKFNTLGQKTSANSTPVVLSSDQSAIPVTDNGGSLTVDGSVTVTQATGTNLHAVIDSGTVSISGSVAVTGPLTDAQLRATPVPISGTVTSNIGTTNGLALDTTVANPQGSVTGGTAGTKSDLVGGIFNTTPPTLTNGQQAALQLDTNGNLKTTATVTVPGTVTVNQGTSPWVVSGTVAATQSGTWNINNISGTVSLPTGAATLAEQQTQTASLSVMDDWDESDRAKVNIIVGEAGVQGNTGTVTTNTQRVTLATDVALPTGTNSIGAVTQATASNFNAQVVGNVADNAADSGNPVKVGALFDSTVPATTYSSGDRTTLISDNVGNLFVNASGRKPTYCAATTFIAAASPTDVFVLTGSATKTIKVRHITVSGTNTGNTNALIDIVKRSTANSGGTSVSGTAVPNDSNSSAATATVVHYTTNPTLGTAVGTVATGHIFFPTLASTNAIQIRDFQLFSNITEPIVLRGTSQSLSVNFRGVNLGGTTVLATKIEWTEE